MAWGCARPAAPAARAARGRPWSAALPDGPQPVALRQHLRVEGTLAVPAQAVIKTVRATLVDANGVTRATQTLKL